MMITRPRKARILGLLLLLGMVVAGFIIASKPRYYSSPTAKRVAGEPWQEWTTGQEAQAYDEPDLLIGDDVHLEISDTEILVRPNRELRDGRQSLPTAMVAEAGIGEAAEFADGTSLQPIAGAYGYVIGADKGAYILETTEFDPTNQNKRSRLKERNAEFAELAEFWPPRKTRSSGRSLLSLIYKLESIPNAAAHEPSLLWDETTGSMLGRNLGMFEINDQLLCDSFWTYVFHPFAAVASVDFNHGAIEEHFLLPEAGAIAASQYLKFAILDVVPGKLAGPIEFSRGLHYRLREDWIEKKSWSIFVASWSTPELVQWADFEVLSKSGEIKTATPLKDSRHELESAFTIFEVPLAQHEIAKFRIRFRPFRKKAIFHLGEIPGTPPANQNLSNLFQVTIPYHSGIDANDVLMHAQLVRKDPYIPISFKTISESGRNVVLRDLWTQALSESRSGRYVIDQRTHEVVYHPPRFQWIRDRLPNWWP